MIVVWRMITKLFWYPIIAVCFAGLLFFTSTLIMYEKMEKMGVFEIIGLPRNWRDNVTAEDLFR